MTGTSSSNLDGAPMPKRARELQESEGLPAFHPSPTATVFADSLQTVQEQAPSTSLSPGLSRRARAGTLPSTFHLETSSRAELLRHLGGLAASSPVSGVSTPVVDPDFPFASRGASSIAASPLPPPGSSSSRLRSGSLTIAPGLASGFGTFGGSSVYGGGAWPRPVGSKLAADLPLSPDSSTYGDDSHVRTLDYLGLEADDTLFGPFSANSSGNGSISLRDSDSFSSLTSDKVRAQGRMRSNTVAAFPKTSEPFTRTRGSTYSSSSTPGLDPVGHHSPSSSTDSSRLLYSTGMLAESLPLDSAAGGQFRARAATIGILDEQRDVFIRRRAGTMANISSSTPIKSNGFTEPAFSSSTEANDSPNWNLSPSPELYSNSPSQPPTRSLWIGNLDPHTTLAELNGVFAPYGPIESTRLLADKCGFVNFVNVADAVRAKEDVLERLGGQLTPSSSLVRIGYGKETSAPSTPLLGRTAISPSLGAMSLDTQSAPTRALWIGSIPPTTTPGQILAVFSPFGSIESARVLSHKSCGFINFERLEDAIAARKSLNGFEILGGETGPVRIGFAKVPSKLPMPYEQTNGAGSLPSTQNIGFDQGLENYHSNLTVGLVTDHPGFKNGPSGVVLEAEQQIHTMMATTSETQLLMRELSGDDPEVEGHVLAVQDMLRRATYYTAIPQHLASHPVLGRRYGNAEALRLRDLRKRFDDNISPQSVDELVLELLDEIVPLSSDYIGNTIVQKIFERATVKGRMAALERIAPHLATIGTHKNGTWSVQKLIQCAQTEEEFVLIASNLRPYTPPLLLNDFGNYVVQGALRFGSPAADFVFDAMVDRIWEIGSGRFGARSARQILETPNVSSLQIKRVAIAILLNSIPLMTSANGALLLTWLLDSSNLPNRYRLLASRLSPHLVHLCTHKLAAVTILKTVSQNVDPQASQTIIDALFDASSSMLEEVLVDQTVGISTISKLVGSRPDARDRSRMVERVKTALNVLHVQTVPAYRRLLEEMGMPYQSPPPPSLASAAGSHFRSGRGGGGGGGGGNGGGGGGGGGGGPWAGHPSQSTPSMQHAPMMPQYAPGGQYDYPSFNPGYNPYPMYATTSYYGPPPPNYYGPPLLGSPNSNLGLSQQPNLSPNPGFSYGNDPFTDNAYSSYSPILYPPPPTLPSAQSISPAFQIHPFSTNVPPPRDVSGYPPLR